MLTAEWGLSGLRERLYWVDLKQVVVVDGMVDGLGCGCEVLITEWTTAAGLAQSDGR